MENKVLPTAGIFIPTMNRVDFVIRQLRYYATVHCPHTIYVGDSSPEEESRRIEKEMERLGPAIKARYFYLPSYSSWQAHYFLITQVKEKYICYSGDDDYQIPNSVTKGIEFLEKNSDYTSASGYAVTFSLKKGGPYGELKSLSDYPRRQIEQATGTERIKQFFTTYYVSHFSVNITADLVKHWRHGQNITDQAFGSEIVPTSLPLIYGKSKIIDCLGFVRQIHDQRVSQASHNNFNWITRPDWAESYGRFEKVLSQELAQKDGIPLEKATKIIQYSLLNYLTIHFQRDYEAENPSKPKSSLHSYWQSVISLARAMVAKMFPFSKYLYRVHLKPKMTGKKEMHYEVRRTGSQYYKDFKPVLNSFRHKDI